MNTFASAINNQTAYTQNGMKARASSANACVDLFYSIGASRGKNVIPQFAAAYAQDRNVALRIAQWARDVRGGAGERQIFRDILNYLENAYPLDAVSLLYKTPIIGRWDDLLAPKTDAVKGVGYELITKALYHKDGLCAKWMPRKGEQAVALRKYLGLTPKEYRKMLVSLTKVVETQMCAKDWDNINFNHVPSVAAARYRAAFKRNTPLYTEYVESLTKGDPATKVNASAIYPHDVLKSAIEVLQYGITQLNKTDLDLIKAQWEALPNYLGENKVLPMVDVSGSMWCAVGGNKNLQCIDIALSLGLYCADKNAGKFKDVMLTFSGTPELVTLRGDIVAKMHQMSDTTWAMNTDIVAAFRKILKVAIEGGVPQHEMPDMVLILSDMQFDQCATYGDSAMQSIRRQYEEAGYAVPKVVFWNLNAYSNVPVSSKEDGTALVSGFSPSLLTSLLAGDMEQFTPEAIMLKTVMNPRYDF